MTRLIHKIWLGEEIPYEYWENIKKLADHLTLSDEKLFLWVDGWINVDGMRDKYNYSNIEIRNIETLQENTDLANDSERYSLEGRSFNKYQYFWFHVFREMIGPNSNYAQASDFLRSEILRQYPGAYIDNDIKLQYKSDIASSSSSDDSDQPNFLFRQGAKFNPQNFCLMQTTTNSDIMECYTSEYPRKMVDELLRGIYRLNESQLMSLKRTRLEHRVDTESQLSRNMRLNLGDYYNGNIPGLLTLWLGPNVVKTLFKQAKDSGDTKVSISCQKIDPIYLEFIKQSLENNTKVLINKIESLPDEIYEEHKKKAKSLIEEVKQILSETTNCEDKLSAIIIKLRLLNDVLNNQDNLLTRFGRENYLEQKAYIETVLAYMLAIKEDEIIFDKTLICGRFVCGNATKVGERCNATSDADAIPREDAEELFVSTLKTIDEKDIDLLIKYYV